MAAHNRKKEKKQRKEIGIERRDMWLKPPIHGGRRRYDPAPLVPTPSVQLKDADTNVPFAANTLMPKGEVKVVMTKGVHDVELRMTNLEIGIWAGVLLCLLVGLALELPDIMALYGRLYGK